MRIAGVHEAAGAFDGAAAVYERSRPGYPPEAVALLARTLGLRPGARLVDLAAGTGKLTWALAATGAAVVAVEPVAGMRHTLAAAARSGSPGGPVSVVAGVAQAVPLASSSVDAVTVAQAFHWFATDAAVAEMARVLRPGGRVALVWNRRDVSDPLQAALTEVMEPRRGLVPSYATGQWRRVLEGGDRLTAVEEGHFPWRQPVDVEGVAERVASVSFIAAMTDADRAVLLDRVRVLATEATTPLALAYVTDVFVYRRAG